MGTLIAGVDCSTQATKVLVLDPDTGAVVAEGRAPHEVATGGGRSETHPDVWWDALGSALHATGRAHDIGALSIAGQQHGLVLQDERGVPLRPAVLWNDTRSADVLPALLEALGGPEGWAAATGSVPVPSFTVTSLAWVRAHEPEILARTRGVRLPHDHLTERLTGIAVTDRGDASGTGWFDPSTDRYVEQVLALPQVDLDPAMLPRVLSAGEPAGTVTAQAAASLGLSPDTLVAAGTGDNMAGALGLGLAQGTPIVSLGTSGTAYVSSATATHDASGVVAGFADADGAFLPLVCTLNCTLAVDRFAGWLSLDREDVAERTEVVALPFLDGERTPNLPRSSGLLVGLRHDTTPQEQLLAVYEGAVASLLGGLDTMARSGAAIDADAPIALLGGGSKGAAWRRTVGRASGRALLLPDATELVAMGAAVQAAAAHSGGSARSIAAAWDTGAGQVLDPIERDAELIERVDRTREAVEAALR
ncbi:MAG: xylulokinase [Nitriliruptoraceae bacterium]|nr:xylulokinase [Nitriliruptoraceae bacterium]